AAAARRGRPGLDVVIDLASAAWMWLDFLGAAVLALAATVLARPTSRRRVVRAIAARGLAIAGIELECTGQDVLADGGRGGVYVCNHASYVDWLVLVAALPVHARFVAKRELARRRPLRWFLARMGVHFVERVEVRARTADAAALARLMAEGQCLVMFPEGTFGRAPGLRPFHLGAFMAAARAGVPVVPVGVSGTRSALRDGSWMPRRGRVGVHIDAPLRPTGTGWSDAVRLRDDARACIARHCGEPLARR
ncbi:MAG TPA: lysophospholipid acyltransferase family protein, partial [Burkholderiaceae bacterium]